MRILAISGSLRAGSSNTVLLSAASDCAPEGVEVVLFEGIDRLPYFNPDLDGDDVPETVAAFRAEVGRSDAVLVSSPEYAHGVPGVFKNALDWLVGSAGCEIVAKPVALLNASPRSTFAQVQIAETLRTMAARVIGTFTLDDQLRGGVVDDAARRTVRAALDGLVSSGMIHS